MKVHKIQYLIIYLQRLSSPWAFTELPKFTPLRRNGSHRSNKHLLQNIFQTSASFFKFRLWGLTEANTFTMIILSAFPRDFECDPFFSKMCGRKPVYELLVVLTEHLHIGGNISNIFLKPGLSWNQNSFTSFVSLIKDQVYVKLLSFTRCLHHVGCLAGDLMDSSFIIYIL